MEVRSHLHAPSDLTQKKSPPNHSIGNLLALRAGEEKSFFLPAVETCFVCRPGCTLVAVPNALNRPQVAPALRCVDYMHNESVGEDADNARR
jgi:hypothetical protein